MERVLTVVQTLRLQGRRVLDYLHETIAAARHGLVAPRAARRGADAHKRLQGRKRHIVVDTVGLLLTVAVNGADVDDASAAAPALGQLTANEFPRLVLLWTGNKYHNDALYAWVQDMTTTGNVVPPKR